MGLIVFLVLLGVFFLVVELVFLPGVTFGTVLALISYGAAIYCAFARGGLIAGMVTVAGVLAVSLVATVISLRAKTWQRLALENKVDGQSQQTPSLDVKVGDKGVAVSRISPMGKVSINGKTYEAKSESTYIDQRAEVEVTGFENASVLVKKI